MVGRTRLPYSINSKHMLTNEERKKIEKLAWYANEQRLRNKELLALCQRLQTQNEILLENLKSRNFYL